MDLVEKYIIARWCYAIGEDFIDDMEYRYVEEKVKSIYPDCKYLGTSWSDDPCPIDLLEKYGLMQYYRDIKFSHQSESIDSLLSWDEVERVFKNLNKPTRLSYKIDGFNIQVNYYNGAPISAETRGRTGNSLNANVVCKIVPQSIPIKGKVKVTGELSIPNDKWVTYRNVTGNTSQRSSVSTALARGDVDFLKFLAFKIQVEDGQLEQIDMFQLLKKYGFSTPYAMTAYNYDGVKSLIERFSLMYSKYNYLADGIVADNENFQLAIRVGAWQEHALESYVKSYNENVGIYGTSMVLGIEPILVEGVRRSQVNVTNLQYIIDNHLEIGAPVAFNVRSSANAVLNAERTLDLQTQWYGKYDEYREMIDRRNVQ